MRVKFIIAIIALAVLCIPAFGQMTASEWLDKGNALTDQGKLDEAIQAFDKAIEINPQFATAWYNKGIVFGMQSKLDEAIQAYDKAIEINPQFESAWYNKGNAIDDQGKYDEAILAYDKAIEINPKFADAWGNKGDVLSRQGKHDEAIQAYNKAIEIDPEDAISWYNKGNSLRSQDKYEEAIKVYDKAIELDPKFAKAWHNKGLALELLGKTSESNAAYAKAKELESEGSTGTPGTTPISPNATGTAKDWFDKGLALDDQGKLGEAIQAYDKAIEIDPQKANAWYNKGLALGKLGLTAESKAAIDRAKELGYTAFSGDSIVGKWINRYDWGCTGSPTQGELNFKGDGTLFDDKDGNGKWTRTGDNIHITWNTGPAVYDGTIQTNTMGGVMSGGKGPSKTGCWSASKVLV